MNEPTVEKNVMSVLTPVDGDLKVEWDRNKPEEVEHAKATFEKMKGKGYAAFRMDRHGDKGEQMRNWDPSAERIILVPAIAAG